MLNRRQAASQKKKKSGYSHKGNNHLFLYYSCSYTLTSTSPFLFSRFHRYTSRCSSPWLEQLSTGHVTFTEVKEILKSQIATSKHHIIDIVTLLVEYAFKRRPKWSFRNWSRYIIALIYFFAWISRSCKKFTLYEDEGDNYNYEKGKFSEIQFVWNEADRTLTIAPRKGSYKGMLLHRRFHIVLVGADSGIGNQPMQASNSVEYDGKAVKIQL